MINRITRKIINELSAIDKAQDIAMITHAGQKRKSGQPYFVHPYRVYQKAKSLGLSKDVQIVALLHDTYEDTPNKQYVQNAIVSGFGKVVMNFILLLSHDKSTDYNQYVLRLAKISKTALTVKLVDMLENLKDNPTEKQKTKYLGAIQYLLDNNISIDPKILNMFNEFK
jgi:GTP pyrophosphokinase